MTKLSATLADFWSIVVYLVAERKTLEEEEEEDKGFHKDGKEDGERANIQHSTCVCGFNANLRSSIKT